MKAFVFVTKLGAINQLNSIMYEPVKIILVDDHKTVRDSLIPQLRQENIYTIGEAANGQELMDLLKVEMLKPDIVVLDIEMKLMNGNQALRILNREFPEIKVIILSGYSDGALINDFISKGACAYVTKASGNDVLINEIKRVKKTEKKPIKTLPKAASQFTDGEIEIIPYILEGKTSAEIAMLLGKSKSTIDDYRARLYEKTGTTNASKFSAYCAKEGLDNLGKVR